VIAAWPELPEAIKTAVRAMVGTVALTPTPTL